MAAPPALLPAEPVLTDPVIVMLTYFRQEVPVLLLFYAYGMCDLDRIYEMIMRTARWASVDTLRRLLYVTQQHIANVHRQEDALAVLTRYIQMHPVVGPPARGGAATGTAATEDLLPPGDNPCAVSSPEPANANVLPHLSRPLAKTAYLAHLIGLLLNHLFSPPARVSQLYDKDHMGALCVVTAVSRHSAKHPNKRIDVCGPLLGQQIRNAFYRMRSYVERRLAKDMTCRSQIALAVRDLGANPGRNMAIIQAAIVAYYESHTISKFIAYCMSTGNWSMTPHTAHNTGNSMAAAVAVKTGVLQQLTNFTEVIEEFHRRHKK